MVQQALFTAALSWIPQSNQSTPVIRQVEKSKVIKLTGKLWRAAFKTGLSSSIHPHAGEGFQVQRTAFRRGSLPGMVSGKKRRHLEIEDQTVSRP